MTGATPLTELVREVDGEDHVHYCPGCKTIHVIPTRRGGWSFNGDRLKPTFSPSVKHDWGPWGDGEERAPKCCHYFIVDGSIQYCSDCTHGLAGQTVPLPVFAEALGQDHQHYGRTQQ